MNSENYEANGYGHDLDSRIIFHELHVSYPTRSGCREKSIHLRRVYFNLRQGESQGHFSL